MAKFISGGACSGGLQSNCYIAAHDAPTGKEAWKFYTAPGALTISIAESWGGAPADKRTRVHLGFAGNLRSSPQNDLLGHRESDAEHAPGRAMTATSTRSRVPRRRISIAIPP